MESSALHGMLDQLRIFNENLGEPIPATFLDGISAPLMIVDDGYRIIKANDRMADLLRLTCQELQGRFCYEVAHKRNAPPSACPHSRTLITGRSHTSEIADAGLGGVFEVTCSPLKNSHGCVIGSLHTACDITKASRIIESAMQSEQIARFSKCVAGESHNLKNLMQALSGGLELSISSLDSGEIAEAREQLLELAAFVNRGAFTAAELMKTAQLHYEQCEEQTHAIVDLTGIAKEALRAIEMWIRRKDAGVVGSPVFRPRFQDECFVHGIEHELFDLIVNVLKNAVEAMPEGGALDVRVGRRKDRVILTVRDEGVGMPRACLDEMFIPFRSGKKAEGGMGIGLAYGAEIVRRHRGKISVSSERNVGTEITVRFPLAEKPV